MIAAGRVVSGALLLVRAFAQTPPNPIEILDKVSEKYSGASQYEILSTSITSTEPGKEHLIKTHLYLKKPDHVRFEDDGIPGIDVGGGDPGPILLPDDGENAWISLPKPNIYMKMPSSAGHPPSPDGKASSPFAAMANLGSGLLQRFVNPLHDGELARLRREDTIKVNGQTFDCYVIEIESRQPNRVTLWIDKSTYLELRQDIEVTQKDGKTTESTTFEIMRLDQPLPDDIFIFKPPAGAIFLNSPPP